MFRNKWRKATFWIWVASFPCAWIGWVLRGYNSVFAAVMVAGVIGSVVGLIILKTLGRGGKE